VNLSEQETTICQKTRSDRCMRLAMPSNDPLILCSMLFEISAFVVIIGAGVGRLWIATASVRVTRSQFVS